MRKALTYAPEVRAEAIAAYRAGESPTLIAKRLGIRSPARVCVWAMDAGCEPQTQRGGAKYCVRPTARFAGAAA